MPYLCPQIRLLDMVTSWYPLYTSLPLGLECPCLLAMKPFWKCCFCHCPSGEQQYPWQSHLNFHHWDIKAYQRYHDFHILLHLVPCSLSSWRVLPPVSPFILSSWSACLSDLTHPVHLLDRDLAVSVHLLASSFCSKQASASRTQTLITPN